MLLARAFSSAARKKVVVVGGNGFVGSAVVRAAVSRDCDVTVISRHAPSEPLADGVRWVQGDMLAAPPTQGVAEDKGAGGVDWRDALPISSPNNVYSQR